MKLQLLLFCIILAAAGSLSAQSQVNRITASLEKIDESSFKLVFTPIEAVSGIGNPLNVYLKIPSSEAPTTTISVQSTGFSLAPVNNFDNVADGFHYYVFQSQPTINLNLWAVGVPVTIATFSTTGSAGTVFLSGGDFGGPISNSGAFFWPGTSLTINNTETNLINWPLSGSVVLPVELVFFKAEKLQDQALLTWQTASELNNDLFEIEHSTDGSSFQPIGKVKGAGTTQEVRDYSFLHRQPAAGINYYRLRQVDLDGRFEYTPIRTLSFDREATERPEILLFPNPATTYLMIAQPDDHLVSWDARLFDVQGKMLERFSLRETQYRLDLSTRPPGIYHLHLTNGQEQRRLRFVKE